jgi:hypothetical protein
MGTDRAQWNHALCNLDGVMHTVFSMDGGVNQERVFRALIGEPGHHGG